MDAEDHVVAPYVTDFPDDTIYRSDRPRWTRAALGGRHRGCDAGAAQAAALARRDDRGRRPGLTCARVDPCRRRQAQIFSAGKTLTNASTRT